MLFPEGCRLRGIFVGTNKNLAVLNRGVTAGFQSAKGEQPLAFPWEGGAPRSESK